MGNIKEKLAEIAELAEQIIDSGVSEQELDEFMNEQLSDDEYELYHGNKDIIFRMIGYLPEEDNEDLDESCIMKPICEDHHDVLRHYKKFGKFPVEKPKQELTIDEMADDLVDFYELWHNSLELGEKNLLDAYTPEQQERYLANKAEVLELSGLNDDFDEDKMREDLFDPQDDPTGRNIVSGEMDETYKGEDDDPDESPRQRDKVKIPIYHYDKEKGYSVPVEDDEDDEDVDESYIMSTIDEYLDEGALGTAAASLIMRGKGSGSYHNVKGKTGDSGDKYEWKKFVDPKRWYNSLDKDEEDEEDEEEDKVDEGCNCGGKRPPVRRPGLFIRRPIPRPTPIKKKLHEKFIEKSDPITDMEIGANANIKKIAKKFLNVMNGNMTRIALIYFGNKQKEGQAEVLYGFFKNIEKGMSSQDAFYESCADENFDGSRKDVVEDRILIANVIKKNFKIDVIYNDERLMPESKDEIFMNLLNEVDYEWMARNNREDNRAPRFAYGQRTYVDPKKVTKNTAPEYDYNERKSALGHIGRKQEILKDMGYDLDTDEENPQIAPTPKELKDIKKLKHSNIDSRYYKAAGIDKPFNKLKGDYGKEEIMMDRLFKKHLKGSKID